MRLPPLPTLQRAELSVSNFQVPVRLYMSSPVVSASPDDSYAHAHDLLVKHGISSLAVVKDHTLVGTISRTDLLRVGRRDGTSGVRSPALIFPSGAVAEAMTSDVATVAPDTPVATAAAKMVKGYIHRVYITENGRLLGVLSTRDLMTVLEEDRTNSLVSEFMSSPVFTIRDEEPISEAVLRLDRAHVSGLIVVEGDWPVGVFGKAEALDAEGLPGSTAVGDVMNPRVLVLPSTTSLHRAASQARALGVRRVVLQNGAKVEGILSGLDFARAIA